MTNNLYLNKKCSFKEQFFEEKTSFNIGNEHSGFCKNGNCTNTERCNVSVKNNIEGILNFIEKDKENSKDVKCIFFRKRINNLFTTYLPSIILKEPEIILFKEAIIKSDVRIINEGLEQKKLFKIYKHRINLIFDELYSEFYKTFNERMEEEKN